MAKLRKMLGDPTGPRAKALMALIDTQSASTWVVGLPHTPRNGICRY
ncbi:MAG: hypothetical protein ACLUUF_05625 [Bifidobacterium pullorum]|nr:hypothetical protein [uncultured Bifidobacterium sp.]